MKGTDRDQDPMSNVLAIYSKHLSRDLHGISARYTLHYYVLFSLSLLYVRIDSVLTLGLTRVSRDDMSSCILIRRAGADTIHSAVVPMWIFYQFMISVVLLRILIVMLTITYKKIYDNMDTQWK